MSEHPLFMKSRSAKAITTIETTGLPFSRGANNANLYPYGAGSLKTNSMNKTCKTKYGRFLKVQEKLVWPYSLRQNSKGKDAINCNATQKP